MKNTLQMMMVAGGLMLALMTAMPLAAQAEGQPEPNKPTMQETMAWLGDYMIKRSGKHGGWNAAKIVDFYFDFEKEEMHLTEHYSADDNATIVIPIWTLKEVEINGRSVTAIVNFKSSEANIKDTNEKTGEVVMRTEIVIGEYDPEGVADRIKRALIHAAKLAKPRELF